MGGDVDRVVVGRAGVELAGFKAKLGDGPFGDVRLRLRIRAERVILRMERGHE